MFVYSTTIFEKFPFYSILVMGILTVGCVSEMKEKYERRISVEKERRETCQRSADRQKHLLEEEKRKSITRTVPVHPPPIRATCSHESSRSPPLRVGCSHDRHLNDSSHNIPVSTRCERPLSSSTTIRSPHSSTTVRSPPSRSSYSHPSIEEPKSHRCDCVLCNKFQNELIKVAEEKMSSNTQNPFMKWISNPMIQSLGINFAMNILHEFPDLTTDIGMKMYKVYKYFKSEPEKHTLGELLDEIKKLKDEAAFLRSSFPCPSSPSSNECGTDTPKEEPTEECKVDTPKEQVKEEIKDEIKKEPTEDVKEKPKVDLPIPVQQTDEETIKVCSKIANDLMTYRPWKKQTKPLLAKEILNKSYMFKNVNDKTWLQFSENFKHIYNITSSVDSMMKEFFIIMKYFIEHDKPLYEKYIKLYDSFANELEESSDLRCKFVSLVFKDFEVVLHKEYPISDLFDRVCIGLDFLKSLSPERLEIELVLFKPAVYRFLIECNEHGLFVVDDKIQDDNLSKDPIDAEIASIPATLSTETKNNISKNTPELSVKTSKKLTDLIMPSQ